MYRDAYQAAGGISDNSYDYGEDRIISPPNPNNNYERPRRNPRNRNRYYQNQKHLNYENSPTDHEPFVKSRHYENNRQMSKILITKTNKDENCEMDCQNKHSLPDCPKLKKLPLTEQLNLIYKLKRCFKCMNKHFSRYCTKKDVQKP